MFQRPVVNSDTAEQDRADAVAKAVIDYYRSNTFTVGRSEFVTADHTHEGLSVGSASVNWAGGPEQWTIGWSQTDAAKAVAEQLGVWFEAINGNTLAVILDDTVKTTVPALTPAAPRIPQPIRYLQTDSTEQATVDAIAAALAEKLGRMIGVEKLHRAADQIEVLIDNGTMVRVTVAALR